MPVALKVCYPEAKIKCRARSSWLWLTPVVAGGVRQLRGACLLLAFENYPTAAPLLVGRVVEDCAVLVLPERGEVIALNQLCARIRELAKGARSVREVVQRICAEYAVGFDTAAADTPACVGEL